MSWFRAEYTYPDESERLLYYGVPAETADCYIEDKTLSGGYLPFAPRFTNFKFHVRTPLNNPPKLKPNQLPCWSVGRLIDIYERMKGKPFKRYRVDYENMPTMDTLIMYFESCDKWDFSKLEK